MDRFKAIESFVMVARTGSFSHAAVQLGVSKAIVSKRISQLEEQLGIRLLYRTTRNLSLTAAGSEYLALCSRLLAELTAEEEALSRAQREPRGLLKVVSAKSFGSLHMAEAVAAFAMHYPDLRIEMEFSTSSPTAVQLADYGFDIGIRIIPAPPVSGVIARKLAGFDWVLCAAPDYLVARGAPQDLTALAAHDCLLNPRFAPQHVWWLRKSGRRYGHKVTPKLSITSVLALRSAALLGAGIGLLPTYCVGEDVRAGRLRRVLPNYMAEAGAVYAVYPQIRGEASAKVKLFTRFLIDRFRDRF